MKTIKNSPSNIQMENTKVPADSEDEVFFTSKVTTSTPADRPAKYGKRKRIPTGNTRRTRLKSKMSGDDGSTSASIDMMDDDGSDESMIAKVSAQLAAINKSIASIDGKIKSRVSVAIAPLNQRLNATNKRLDRMESKAASELEDLQVRMGEQIMAAVEEKIANLEGRSKSTPSLGVSYADKAGFPGNGVRPRALGQEHKPSEHIIRQKQTAGSCMTGDGSWYWSARKCLRFFPVPGTTKEAMLSELVLGMFNRAIVRFIVPALSCL